MVFSFQILGRQPSASWRHGLAFAVLGLSGLAGCGQKGPLFLPPPVKPVPAVSAPQPAVVAPALPASASR
ncbi:MULTISPECIES: LPS translocon maturation chaperone LptM [Polaromonas]|uniref:Lipoprotein n=2 Tax=Polaromonas TaxID=52972 RepID=A0ABW1U085_9BURK